MPGLASAQVAQVKAAIKEYGITMSLYDLERLVAFLDTEKSGFVSVPTLLSTLRGPFAAGREQEAREIFSKLTAKTGTRKSGASGTPGHGAENTCFRLTRDSSWVC